MSQRVHTGPFTISPNRWIARAYRETGGSGAAVAVGLYCWHLERRWRRRAGLVVKAADVEWEFEVSRSAFFRALLKLETAGLLRVRRRPRHGCVVTLPTDAEMEQWGDGHE